MPATQPLPDDGLEPAYAAPRNACDAHFHVFGPADKYPHVTTDLRYQPPHAPLAEYVTIARRLGFERFVFVQPSAYGLDNACMLDAMDELDPAIRRGIVHLDEATARDADLARWHDIGVRGVRINTSPIRKPEAGLADALRPKIVRTAKVCRELGWHVDLLGPGWLVAALMPTLPGLPVAFPVAPIGLFPAARGPSPQGFRDFWHWSATAPGGAG